ncbi:MAG: hypothetical protein EOO99_11200 [Pedobacter sp.]|nr:MAG: hypothetical protein EOO99_11200 [Pedobacter sp.]
MKSRDILLHGPSKNYVSAYHWHQMELGVIASYTPNAEDVKDHFGVFRGVDMIESFCQATAASLSIFFSCYKRDKSLAEAHEEIIPLFISIGKVNFMNYLKEGETFISMGKIKFYKFRQMVCDGRIYKVPANIDLNDFFKNYTATQFNNYDLPEAFTLVAELYDITGRGFKKNKLEI